MKATEKNVNKVFKILLEQLSDKNGRGEFDEKTDLLSAVEMIIDWIKYEKWLKNRFKCDYCNKGFQEVKKAIAHQNKCLA